MKIKMTLYYSCRIIITSANSISSFCGLILGFYVPITHSPITRKHIYSEITQPCKLMYIIHCKHIIYSHANVYKKVPFQSMFYYYERTRTSFIFCETNLRFLKMTKTRPAIKHPFNPISCPGEGTMCPPCSFLLFKNTRTYFF